MAKQLKILALDLATKTGWAHSCGQSGVWNLSILSDESSGMRLIRFEAKLEEIRRGIGVDLVAFEEVSAARGLRADLNVIKLATKLQAVIERWCLENGVEHCSRNIQTIKAHAMPLVKGAKCVRDKDAMFEAAKKKWPETEFESDDEVDARWLLDLVQSELTPSGTE